MNISVIYLLMRAVESVLLFLRHWYVDSFLWIAERTMNRLEAFDHSLAFRVTLKHFFKPMYQDYSIPGYIFGFFFRTTRILIALVLYALLFLSALFAYIVWAFIPLYILFLGFGPQ